MNPRITWASFPNPCYNPQTRHGDCPDTLLQLIEDERIDAKDRLWAFARCTALPDSVKRRFAVRVVRETPLKDGRTVADLLTDPRSTHALEVAWRHAEGQATDEELEAAWAAARAAWVATGDAARAAWEAARAAARDAARDAGDAARDTWAATWAAAWDAARNAQIETAKSLLGKLPTVTGSITVTEPARHAIINHPAFAGVTGKIQRAWLL